MTGRVNGKLNPCKWSVYGLMPVNDRMGKWKNGNGPPEKAPVLLIFFYLHNFTLIFSDRSY